MREQRGFGKAGLISRYDDRCRHARNIAEQHFLAAQRQRDQRGARLDQLEAELPREIIGEAGGAHLGDRGAAGRDYQRRGAIGAGLRGNCETVALFDADDLFAAADLDTALGAFLE